MPETICTVVQDCTSECIDRCAKCGKPFCLDHASELDPAHYCEPCLNQDNISFQEKPLIDTEGVKHKGRVLVPLGEMWRSSARTIADLSDAELDQWLSEYSSLVNDAEKTLEYRKGMLHTAQFEKEERSYKRHRTAIKVGGKLTEFPAGKPTEVKKLRKTAAQSAMDKLKALGLTPEMIAAAAAALKSKGA